MKIAFCGEDIECYRLFQKVVFNNYVEKQFEISFRVFTDETSIIDYIENEMSIDIFYIEEKSYGIDGFAVAKEIRKRDSKVLIIFLASSSQNAISGYCVRAFDFILKPVTIERVHESFSEAFRFIQNEKEAFFINKTDDGYYKIYLNDIIFIETYKHNIMIHTKWNTLICYKTMSQMSSILDYRFYRIHESFIINLYYITEIHKSFVIADEKQFPVSRANMVLFRHIYNEFMKNNHIPIGGKLNEKNKSSNF